MIGTARIRGALSRWRESASRTPWPRQHSKSPTADRVAIVVVNYETRTMTSQLIYTLYRVLGGDQFAELVVVDNGSADGSIETLRALHEAGLVTLIANERQRYHGPGLNQALSLLAKRQREIEPDQRIDFVWTLDSDVVLLRREAVRDALAAFNSTGAAAIGQANEPHSVHGPTVNLHSLMIDPSKVWTRGVPPFLNSGEPSRALQEACIRRDRPVVPFPFTHHSYLIHLGAGTLRGLVASGRTDNAMFEWARGRPLAHYSAHPLGQLLHERVLELYDEDVGSDDPAALVGACKQTSLRRIPEARPLPPFEELKALFDAGVNLTEHFSKQN